MKHSYTVKQLLNFRKEHSKLCFENVIYGNLSSANFEIDILNIIQDDYLERRPFDSVADFLLRYNYKSLFISEKDVEDYPEKLLCEKISKFIKESKQLFVTDFEEDIRLYKEKLQEVLPKPISNYPHEAVTRRFQIIFEELYSPLTSERRRQISNLFS